ncbi:hypothetical protein JTE90_003491 [Oedothorax gibbosus]|uniref:Transposable element P transposase-like RNase H domain-containing protein n=1 Tax=Oedothorax gibbosus TaxID=931172 RepID=A0AAV6UGJ8_9ARAC|nr:hypothetical protein JTE90_003491 [Oedothorax gibbosus]
MKSPRLYEHIRINRIMTLPGRTCLQKSLKAYKSGYGFNEKMFTVLKEKLKKFDSFKKHGNLLFDEMKLSEHLKMKSDGYIEGYVDYGSLDTPEELKSHTSLCDHGMVFLFVPFVGDWAQVPGVFATKGNMKADLLAKMITEAIIYAENAGLFVDCVTGDGASWNRKMWKKFGIG